MRHFVRVLPLFLLFQTCVKEKEPTQNFTYNGTLLDASTNEPIPQVSLHAYSSGGDVNDAWNGTLYADIHQTIITDSGGHFDFVFDKELLDYKRVNLGATNMPGKYQYYITPGNPVKSLFFDFEDYYVLSESEKFEIISGDQRTIYVYPKTSFRFVLPQITNTLKHDTLVMYMQGNWPNNGSYSVFLGNTVNVNSFRSVRNLINANRVKGFFELRRNGVLKTGIFDMFCNPSDTTDVSLNL
jgi:hypothetical protein